MSNENSGKTGLKGVFSHPDFGRNVRGDWTELELKKSEEEFVHPNCPAKRKKELLKRFFSSEIVTAIHIRGLTCVTNTSNASKRFERSSQNSSPTIGDKKIELKEEEIALYRYLSGRDNGGYNVRKNFGCFRVGSQPMWRKLLTFQIDDIEKIHLKKNIDSTFTLVIKPS